MCRFLFTNGILILLRNEDGHIICKNLGHPMHLQDKIAVFCSAQNRHRSLSRKSLSLLHHRENPHTKSYNKVYYYIQITLSCESKDPMRQINLEWVLIHSVCIQLYELTKPLPFVPVQDISFASLLAQDAIPLSQYQE